MSQALTRLGGGGAGLGVFLAVGLAACGGQPGGFAAQEEGAATSATTRSFQDGVSPASNYSGVMDTSLFSSQPNTLDNADTAIRVDNDYPDGTGQHADTLLRVDVSSIPANATVSAVKLTVNVTNRTTGAGYALYALAHGWTSQQATWNTSLTTTKWAAGGARGSTDRSSTVLGTLVPTVTGKYTVSLDAAGVAAVQAWVKNPANNFGFVIDGTNSDGLVMDSCQATTLANRPQLAVTYAVPSGTPPPVSGSGFVHPGILVSKAQLDDVKAHLTEEPYASALASAKTRGKYGQLTYTAHPVKTMNCGNAGGASDAACDDSRDDALAAWQLSLIWYLTGDQRYAARAEYILDAWSELQSLPYDSKNNNTWNNPLQASWLAELFPRSAELLRHGGNSGWPEANAQAFGAMLERALLPNIINAWYGGSNNWSQSMTSGTLNIGIYNDDAKTYQAGLALWRTHAKLNMYNRELDGALPIAPKEWANADGSWKSGELAVGWYGQPEFNSTRTDGITAEFCRDLSHTQMGFASVVNGAETAGIQGVDLWNEGGQRILKSAEFVTGYLNEFPSTTERTVAVGSWLCNGSIKPHEVPTWEVVFHHFRSQGVAMPNTEATIKRMRSEMFTSHTELPYTNLQMAWEVLTHGVPASQLP